MQQGQPLAYVSKALGPRSRALSVYEKEYMAILLAMEQWRAYLQVHNFVIKIDQKSLAHFQDQMLHTPWKQKALTKQLGFNYEIVYQKGSYNTIDDTLPTRPHDHSKVLSISHPTWLVEISDNYKLDDKSTELLQQFTVDPNSKVIFQLRNGLI